MTVLIISALSMAAVLTPIVIGLNLIIRVSHVGNFSAGFVAVFAAAAAMAWSTTRPLTAVILTIMLGAGIGACTYLLAVFPATSRGADPTGLAISTLGFGLALAWIGEQAFGSQPSVLPPWISGTVEILGAHFAIQHFVVIVSSIALMAVVGLTIDHTGVGRAIEGVAHDAELARLYGVRDRHYIVLTWIVAGAVTSIGGIFSATLSSVASDSSLTLLVYAFIGAIVGGFGSIFGSVIGAFIAALTMSATAQFITPELQMTSVFVLLLGVLLIRPQGILGAREATRV